MAVIESEVARLQKVVHENRFQIRSLKHLLALVDLAAPKPLTLAADILGKNETVLLRAGQPISSTALNYLKNNDNYVPEFWIQVNADVCSPCGVALAKKIESIVASQRINALTRAVTTMKSPMHTQVQEVFKESRLLLSLYSLQAFGEEAGQFLFEHSVLTGVLTMGIAGEMDEVFRNPPYSTEAFQTGLLHDLVVPNYLERVMQGQEAVEEPTHAEEAAQMAELWGLPAYCSEAIRRQHNDFKGKKETRKPKSNEEKVLIVALATAERFATLCDLLGRTKEDEACFMVAHLADQGKLDKEAVRALGLVIHAKQIVSDVERLSQIEKLCPNDEAAYVYPKVVHATPTKVVCKRNLEECPLFIGVEPPLVVLNQAGETSLADGMLALPPGEYRKCALSTKLAEAVA